MSFFAYLLHCRGGAFYVGHTDYLERRLAEHQSGAVAGFTADRQPVELVWSERFATREEAKAAEAQIKGWSRAKKLALIRGDWERISELAKGKDGPSTSSGRTGLGEGAPLPSVCPELVEGLNFSLSPHPDHPPLAVRAVSARVIGRDAYWLVLRWRVEGAARIVLPAFAGKRRADGLWQATCCELFVMDGAGPGYAEFNFSPSEAFAAYDFAGYRDGMREPALPQPPVITPRRGGDVLIVDVALPVAALPRLPALAALTMVIEEEGGTRSFWALAHAPGQPDFHAGACFTATLPAPDGP